MSENNPLAKLRQYHSSIGEKINDLSSLNESYKEKEEKEFLKKFINEMDRMSNQLLEEEKLYQNIDEEIDRDADCLRLKDRLNFYKEECLTLREQLAKKQQELEQCRKRNKNYEGNNLKLQHWLRKQFKKEARYKIMNQDLSSGLKKQRFSKSYRPSSRKIKSSSILSGDTQRRDLLSRISKQFESASRRKSNNKSSLLVYNKL